MMTINSLLQKIRIRKVLYRQLLLVVLAFAVMIVSSSLYVSNMLRNHLCRDATDMLAQTRLMIEAEFIEPQTTLVTISEVTRSMILRGDSANAVLKMMKQISRQLQNKSSGFKYSGLYGYFEAFGGAYLSATEWNLPKDFTPPNRPWYPWYKAAVEAEDKVGITPVYFNLFFNDTMVTVSRRIFDDGGKPLGVVCLNMSLDQIKNNIADMHLTKNSYGFLVDKKLNILYHPVLHIIGKNIREISGAFSLIADKLDRGDELFEQEIKNYRDETAITFSAKLENGWVLINVTPKAEYYRELNKMIRILVIIGGILAATLSLVLINIDRARNKAAEENSQKSILLAEMEKARATDELTQLLLDATPLVVSFWNIDSFWDIDNSLNNNQTLKICNEGTVRLFGLKNRQEYFSQFNELSPKYQPCGRMSKELAIEYRVKATKEGYCNFEWMHQKPNGEPIPCEITLVRIKYKGDFAIAGYTRDLREHKQMMNKIELRDNLLNTINYTAVLFLSTENDENMMASIMAGMEFIGRSVEVDRVHIWQNEVIDGELYFVHKYEWLSELGDEKGHVPTDLRMSYNEKPVWKSKFFRGEYINSPLRELPQSDQDLLVPYGIKSIAIIPLFLQDKFWGFFSLDDCRSERTFSEEEIRILRSGGLLIANAFLRNDMMQNIRSTTMQLEAALKEARDANAAKSQFLAAMSHEIRTPMNVILGVTESQLLYEKHPEEVKKAFEKIYNSGDLLLHIINDILDLSKVEAGKLELLPAKYEVLSMINDVANINIILFGYKRLGFKLKVDENIPHYLYGDELRIKQILNNVLSNAFKYTDEGEVALSFGAEKTDENKMTFIIKVSDTGQGMTAEQVNKMFDKYTRFNIEANRTSTGTGLGMTITRNLVKMMGGQIFVDSTPGKGTTFTICIQQEIIGSEVFGREIAEKLQSFYFTNQMRERHSQIVREAMPYGKVLVVDDMPSNVDVAKLLLNPYKLQIDIAVSGFEAIDMIKSGKEYDIVFMDHMMPKMDGMEATRKLRELGYKHPIIALTANAVSGQKDIFLANGFDGYISKPIDIRQLNDSLNRFIRDKNREYNNSKAEPKQEAEEHELEKKEESEMFKNKIPGVNMDLGLDLYGGDTDIYISVLHSFYNNASAVIEKLSDVSQESLNSYAINVHGLKSISASIGAEKIQEAAYNLEMMAKSNDLAGVLAGNKAFLKDVETLVNDIQTWLKDNDA